MFLDIVLLKIVSKLRKKGQLSLDVERKSIILFIFIQFQLNMVASFEAMNEKSGENNRNTGNVREVGEFCQR